MITDTTELPRWDVESIFPSLDSPAYASAREAWRASLDELRALFERHGIGAGVTPASTNEAGRALEEVIAALSSLRESTRRLSTYVSALVATDASDTAAVAERSRLFADAARVASLQTRLNGWIAACGAEALARTSALAEEHESWLRRCSEQSAHEMSEREEDLLAAIEVPGVEACATLAGELSSTLKGTLRGESRPISVLRGMAAEDDPELRREAYDGELAAWEAIATPMAACLNAITGHAVIVDRRRNWPDTLAAVLWHNRVTPEILEVMQTAARESFPDFRRFLTAKAEVHGYAGTLPWWDLVAPVPGAAAYDWSQAEAAVTAAFGTFTPRLRELAARAFRERWVDAEPRPGKRGGGFCMAIGEGASRILMNYDGSFDSVQTLAHELGHAYHHAKLASRPPLLRPTPMALAETASIFCETIMVQAGLEGAGDRERLALLNADLLGATQVVVDIDSRFRFESELFRRRADAPLSVQELCDAMTAAQAETYGDGVDRATYHPWMWAVKPHYYNVHRHFYNWPYCFGLLFGIGLYARYLADPVDFRADYDDLLSATGMLNARELASRFGIDLCDLGFWRSSLDVIRARIDDFVALAARA
jgi:oligoendopeptidase F